MEHGINSACFSSGRTHRFYLSRSWSLPGTEPFVTFIGLNPSTANENTDDPTIRRIINFSKRLGFGAVYMTNLFTYVTAYPSELKECNNPLLDADKWIEHFSKISEKVVFCWGSFPAARERAKQIIAKYPNAYCLGKNSDGSPKHPLYLPSTAELIKFQ